MAHLQEQLEELEVLESMFSSPGEFKIEDRASYDQAIASLSNLAMQPPKCLVCSVCISIKHYDSEEDDSEEEEGHAIGGVAGKRRDAITTHSVKISFRLPTRSGQDRDEVRWQGTHC